MLQFLRLDYVALHVALLLLHLVRMREAGRQVHHMGLRAAVQAVGERRLVAIFSGSQYLFGGHTVYTQQHVLIDGSA